MATREKLMQKVVTRYFRLLKLGSNLQVFLLDFDAKNLEVHHVERTAIRKALHTLYTEYAGYIGYTYPMCTCSSSSTPR